MTNATATAITTTTRIERMVEVMIKALPFWVYADLERLQLEVRLEHAVEVSDLRREASALGTGPECDVRAASIIAHLADLKGYCSVENKVWDKTLSFLQDEEVEGMEELNGLLFPFSGLGE